MPPTASRARAGAAWRPDLVSRAVALVPADGRALLGIAGKPGSGKSTLAARLVTEVNARTAPGWAVNVPMDGFHLAHAELTRLGLVRRKGAPETFDADGYAALLHRLRSATDRTVYAPAFDRRLEDAVAGSIAVTPEARLVVTEGNYLLLDTEPWRRVRSALDEVWFCTLEEEERVRRLIGRHIEFGKQPAAAEAFVRSSDERNAALVAETRTRADLVVPAQPPARHRAGSEVGHPAEYP